MVGGGVGIGCGGGVCGGGELREHLVFPGFEALELRVDELCDVEVGGLFPGGIGLKVGYGGLVGRAGGVGGGGS